MRAYISAMIIASGLCLQSCGLMGENVVNITSPDDFKKMVTLEHDPYTDVTIIESPNVYLTTDRRWFAFLVTGAFKRGDQFYRHNDIPVIIHLVLTFSDWQFLDRAFALGGKKLKMKQVSRDVGNCYQSGCAVYEQIGIEISLKELRDIVSNGKGFQFQVRGRLSGIPIFLEQNILEGFLDAVEEKTKKI